MSQCHESNYSDDESLKAYEPHIQEFLPKGQVCFCSFHAEAKRVIDEKIAASSSPVVAPRWAIGNNLRALSIFHVLHAVLISARRETTLFSP